MNNSPLSQYLELFNIYGIPIEEYPMEKYADRTSEDLRSSARAIGRRLDNLHIDAALTIGVLPLTPEKRFWTLDEINWDDPRLQEIKKQCWNLTSKKTELNNVAEMRDAITKNSVRRLLAEEKAYKWGAKYTLEESVTIFKTNGLKSFGQLIELLIKNPHYIEEVIL